MSDDTKHIFFSFSIHNHNPTKTQHRVAILMNKAIFYDLAIANDSHDWVKQFKILSKQSEKRLNIWMCLECKIYVIAI